MTIRRDYDSTVARIAGNILSGQSPSIERTSSDSPTTLLGHEQYMVRWAVAMARAIVAETRRTEPEASS